MTVFHLHGHKMHISQGIGLYMCYLCNGKILLFFFSVVFGQWSGLDVNVCIYMSAFFLLLFLTQSVVECILSSI